MALRIALAEDSFIVREGIEQVLRGDGEIEVAASCATTSWSRGRVGSRTARSPRT